MHVLSPSSVINQFSFCNEKIYVEMQCDVYFKN